MEHELKVWPEFFDALADGRKQFEMRKDDRGFKPGDTLRLREYSPGPDEYTGREVTKKITYMLWGDDPASYAFGVRGGFVVMSLA